MRNPSPSSFRTFRLPNFLGSKREELSQASVSQEEKQGKEGFHFSVSPSMWDCREEPLLSLLLCHEF